MIISLPSVEQAGLDWHGEVEEVKSQPIVLILPGLHFSQTLPVQLLVFDAST